LRKKGEGVSHLYGKVVSHTSSKELWKFLKSTIVKKANNTDG